MAAYYEWAETAKLVAELMDLSTAEVDRQRAELDAQLEAAEALQTALEERLVAFEFLSDTETDVWAVAIRNSENVLVDLAVVELPGDELLYVIFPPVSSSPTTPILVLSDGGEPGSGYAGEILVGEQTIELPELEKTIADAAQSAYTLISPMYGSVPGPRLEAT